MTASELLKRIRIELDKTTNAAVPSFLNSEIQPYVDKALKTLVRQKVNGHNVLQQGVGSSTFRDLDLQKFITEITTTSSFATPNEPKNVRKFEIVKPAGVMLLDVLDPLVRYEIDDITVKKSLRPVTEDIFNKFIVAEENYPYIPNPIIIYFRYDDNSKIWCRVAVDPELITDSLVFTFYFKAAVIPTKYLFENATNIDTIEYDFDFTDELISLTCDYLLENIESPRLAGHNQILTQNAE